MRTRSNRFILKPWLFWLTLAIGMPVVLGPIVPGQQEALAQKKKKKKKKKDKGAKTKAQTNKDEDFDQGPPQRPFEVVMLESLPAYLEIHKYLAQGRLWRIHRSAGLIALKFKGFLPEKMPPGVSPLFRDIPTNLRRFGRLIYKGKDADIEKIRIYFKEISRSFTVWASIARPPGLDVYYCPVFNATWLQEKGAIQNPYYGPKMLTSGQLITKGPVGPSPKAQRKREVNTKLDKIKAIADKLSQKEE